ncbi:S1 family peptidase [Mycolicibacterium fortuitum]|uniref:S1 family peptidase n=1 Tax=Mycolicibacterium fortuitum TaxID=1766 RepID=UPI0009D641F8|nr:serine protease [Mycolicibacterium fortuitum]
MGTDLPNLDRIEIDPQTFQTLKLSTVNSSVVPLVVITQETVHCVGTAFCISPTGIWITARHVLEGRDGAIEIRDRNPKSYIAILWVGSGLKHDVPELLGGAIPIKTFTRHPASGSDLALLRTDMPSIQFPALRLSAELPVENTPIMGLGYAQIEVETYMTQANNPPTVNVEPNLNASTGRVLQLFQYGRDTFIDLDGNFTGKLPTVCFETSARFDSGMSGGPVLDPTGAVRGVISTGLEQAAGEQHDTSFVSATPYLFMMKVAYGYRDKPISLFELATRRIVPTDTSFQRLRMVESDEQIDIYYDAPNNQGCWPP